MLERYSRQTVLAQIGKVGQELLLKGSVAVIGCGALGCTIANLLARAGAGRIVLVDRDVIEMNNLQRQTLYDEADLGQPKAEVACQKLRRVNGQITITGIICDLEASNIGDVLAGVDLVMDGTDNILTRMLINDHCVKKGIPWIYGGVIGITGMTMNVLPGGPCLRCILPRLSQSGSQDTCDTVGVLNTLPAMIAAMQVTEAIKILTKAEPSRDLKVLDGWAQRSDTLHLVKAEDCPCCVKGRYEFLDAKIKDEIVVLCGRNAVQITPAQKRAMDFAGLAKTLDVIGDVRFNDLVLVFSYEDKELTLFRDGRGIIKGTNDPGVAKSFYARYIGQ